jgi:hypothetical protein
MANSVKIPRGFLIMAICLPLAVLLGYFIAEPLNWGSLAVLVLVSSVLAVPLMMKWHHPLTVLCWNACIAPSFLPGQLDLWVVVAMTGCLFAVLNRSVNPARRFIQVPQVTASLIFLASVVFITALFTGGMGMRILGSSQFGGRRYLYIFAAIAGYFVLTSQKIPQNRAPWYLVMFFLPGLTGLAGNMIYKMGSPFYFLFNIFPAAIEEQVKGDYAIQEGIARLGGLTIAAAALYSSVLGYYGLRGILNFSKPWRVFLFTAAVVACVASGYRSAFILFLATLGALFYLEGLHRTRWMAIFFTLGLAGALIILPQAYRLPWVVQRTLSFLPAKIDPFVKGNSQSTTDWRVEMWKSVLPEIPRYLLKGKGYALDPDEMFMEEESAYRNKTDSFAGAKAAGDYHNGPLSVIIPFGIWGVVGFLWFLVAGGRTLYFYYRWGDERLKTFNTYLLAFFIGKLVLFFFVFGGFYGDLFAFTGLVGLGVSLNGPPVIQNKERDMVLTDLAMGYAEQNWRRR